MDTLLEGLNTQQEQAVLHDQGPLLVIAGPGSGKTTILTRRIAYLLNKSQGSRYKILALTFTNKAANEMRQRIESLVGSESVRLFITTFHGFCHDVLRKYGDYIGIDNEFTMYESADTNNEYAQVLQDAIKEQLNVGQPELSYLFARYADEQQLRNEAPKLLSAINRLKNRLVFSDDIESLEHLGIDPVTRAAYKVYDAKLRESNVLDYSDLLMLTYKLFRDHPYLSKQYRSVYKYLLIDEAQDTNRSQLALLKALCGNDFRNVFVVADEDQLIYGWNDARFEYLMEFVNGLGAGIVQMFENYRCPPDVLEYANRLIKLNLSRLSNKRDLVANVIPSTRGSIRIQCYETPEQEAVGTVEEILKLDKYDETCVIARNRSVLKAIETELAANDVPYHLPSSTTQKFVSREMKLLMNLYQAVFNEEDRLHVQMICGYFQIPIEDLSLMSGSTLFSRFISHITTSEPELAKVLINMLANKRGFWSYTSELVEIIARPSTIYELDELDGLEGNNLFLEDYEQLKRFYAMYNNERPAEEHNIGDFLSSLALYPTDISNSTHGVSLLTGHAAKGLEFNYVFVVSLNQGVFPDFRATQSQALEEERRNFFVAITRTKKRLFLSFTNYRGTRFGLRQQRHSQFIDEMGISLAGI